MTIDYFDTDQLKQLAQHALDYAKKLGASSAETHIAANNALSIHVRQQQTEELTYHRNHALAITVFNGQRQGHTSSSDLSPDAIKTSVEAAWAIAKQTDKDPYAGLADKNLLAQHILDLDLYHPWNLSPEEAIDIAKRCEAYALSENKQITNSEGASLSTQIDCRIYANTNGFCDAELSTHHSLNCVAIAESANGMQREHSYNTSVKPFNSREPEIIGKDAAVRAIRRLDARPIKTQKTSVIFSADVARSLLGHFLNAISGGAIFRNASFLAGALGEKIFPEWVEIYERPYLPCALGSAAYDSEGVATREQNFVKDGRLERYLLSSYSARRLGLETTANADGAHNLFIKHQDHTLDSLFKEMGSGFFVTELLGQGANLMTGDYSRGASGFWVENGEIAFPVEGVTVASNLRDMFMQIQAIGKDVETRGNLLTGSIWIDSMTLGGI